MSILRTLTALVASTGKVPGLRSTYRPRVGPFQINTSAHSGVSSVSVGAGPLRYKVWDRKGATGLSSVDLPGPISWRPPKQK